MDDERNVGTFRIRLATAGVFALVGPAMHPIASAQDTGSPLNLLSPLDMPEWEDPSQVAEETILRSRPMTVDFGVIDAIDPATLNGLSSPIELAMFDDAIVTVVFDSVEARLSFAENGEDTIVTGYTWHGWVVDGYEGHIVMITESDILLRHRSSEHR